MLDYLHQNQKRDLRVHHDLNLAEFRLGLDRIKHDFRRVSFESNNWFKCIFS